MLSRRSFRLILGENIDTRGSSVAASIFAGMTPFLNFAAATQFETFLGLFSYVVIAGLMCVGVARTDKRTLLAQPVLMFRVLNVPLLIAGACAVAAVATMILSLVRKAAM